eukprot:Plantae.Rhodophyta-Purpureofilum_apyrenoidigerum.ctg6208.p1 GENE.Plantae.Rhodophyta-Purpureofilum_apyrenoidigerum.ctg6208~~Plantae.Rhodophyta-Purpureofilum_apyrenoidigerum.ctg6208.p1  ORF type:complete len:281 (-),score=47.19 Plantae.Rhodophyta-Purpureofilum_apyrenoidigerum.ctg6208:864-1706(-)
MMAAMVMDRAVELAKTYSELPDLQAYLIAAVGWALMLIPSHLISNACSTTYKKGFVGKMSVEWLSRCVSNIHAVVVSVIIAVSIFGETSAYKGGNFEYEWLCRTGLRFAVGYFMYDACLVIYSIKTITAGPTTFCHHVLVGSIVHYTLVKRTPLVVIWAAGAYLTELSTPFVNARWFLSLRHKDEMIYKVSGILMTFSFFLARIVYMPAFLVFLFTSDGLIESIPNKELAFRYGIIGMFGHIALYALNLYWFNLIMRGLIKLIKDSRKSEHKNGRFKKGQ